MQIEISEGLADEIREWAKEQRDYWPKDTAYQADLADLIRQLDSVLPSIDDVRGIMASTKGESE